VAGELTVIRRAVTEWSGRTPLRPEQLEAVRLATYEATVNVVEHAYQHDHTGVLDLDATCRLQHRTVAVTVRDHGRWRPAAAEPNSTRGRGLLLIRRLADFAWITTTSVGTTVRMAWTLDHE